MATRRTKSVRVLRYSEEFTAGLSSAILEWLLIFLLFVNAVFSYLVTKFARFCKLKIPCILCSRLDHVLGKEKPGFYRDLICGAHKLEISSLVFCHVHDKLADVHGMCEGCLFSFATKEKSNSERYRLLVGKLGIDHEFLADKNLLHKNTMLDSSSEWHCTCCNQLWKTTPYTHRLFPKKSIGSEVAKFDIRRPGSVVHSGLKPFDGLKKQRAYRGRGFDPLFHVGYSELKITSDSESEVPLSDDEDPSAPGRETNNPKERCQPETHTNVSDTLLNASHDNLVSKELVDQVSPVPLLLVPHECHDVGQFPHITSSASAIAVGHGLEELNWQQFEQKSRPSALSDLISLHDEPSSSNTEEVAVEVSRVNYDVAMSGNLVGTSDNGRKGVCRSETGLAPATVQCSEDEPVVEASGETFDILRTVDVGQISSSESGEACQSDNVLTQTTGLGSKGDLVLANPVSSLFTLTGLGDVYKSSVGNKEGQPSSMSSDLLTAKNSAKANEDLKLLITQISSSRGSDSSANDSSPRVRGLLEEIKISNTSSSIGLETLQKRISIERNESGFESLDGSVVTEIEGESVVDHMKRQIEYDRKCMSALYKELDEERNASAVAANQAMAMITRLQEEKAALHMEALQYLRMMEEQAEYDVEALQKANDLLAEKEKEIQDLEADLDYYRIKYPEEEMEENMLEPFDYKVVNMAKAHSSDLSCSETNATKLTTLRVENASSTCSRKNTNGACDQRSTKISEHSSKPDKPDAVPNDDHMSIIPESLLNLEDERLYISQSLKKLEKKLDLWSDKGDNTITCNGVYTGNQEEGSSDMEQDHSNMVIQRRNQTREDKSSVHRDSYLSRGGSPAQERSSPSSGDSQFFNKGKCNFDGSGASIACTTNDLGAVESEILDLNERLETLEADIDFLEHTLNSLQIGDEGVKFVQEIAVHLRELRRIGIRRRETDVA